MIGIVQCLQLGNIVFFQIQFEKVGSLHLPLVSGVSWKMWILCLKSYYGSFKPNVKFFKKWNRTKILQALNYFFLKVGSWGDNINLRNGLFELYWQIIGCEKKMMNYKSIPETSNQWIKGKRKETSLKREPSNK